MISFLNKSFYKNTIFIIKNIEFGTLRINLEKEFSSTRWIIVEVPITKKISTSGQDLGCIDRNDEDCKNCDNFIF